MFAVELWEHFTLYHLYLGHCNRDVLFLAFKIG